MRKTAEVEKKHFKDLQINPLQVTDKPIQKS